MSKSTRLCTLAALVLAAAPANAEDDPNATAAAEKARIEAQTALINAEAARINARAARDKAKIEALGLPKFDNKTTLENDGGAIETAMLSSRAIDAAAATIAGADGVTCSASGSKIVVLADDEKFDLNLATTMRARIEYHNKILLQAMGVTKTLKPDEKHAEAFGAPIAIASAIAGLFGNETKVTGVELPEIGNAMLAIAVAGKLKDCANLPRAGAGVADLVVQEVGPSSLSRSSASIPSLVTDLAGKRAEAAIKLAKIPEKATGAKKEEAERLKLAIAAFDEFYKGINTPDDDGQTAFVRAVLVDRVTARKGAKLLRVAVERAGGTITNSKNIWTFFGADPVRVSGGLVVSYVLVDAHDGTIGSAGSFACQTTQARLRNVQAGNWLGPQEQTQQDRKKSAFCQ